MAVVLRPVLRPVFSAAAAVPSASAPGCAVGGPAISASHLAEEMQCDHSPVPQIF